MRKLNNDELDRLSPEAFRQSPKTPLIIILDNIRSLNNVGAVFRTSDAFLIERIYLCGITATPPHRDIRKTALGATETVSWSYAANTLCLISELQAEGIYVIAVEQAEKSTSLKDYCPNKNLRTALVFGNEVRGVSQEVVSVCDEVVEIPQHGTKHSLNISVSVGLVVWDMYCKLH